MTASCLKCSTNIKMSDVNPMLVTKDNGMKENADILLSVTLTSLSKTQPGKKKVSTIDNGSKTSILGWSKAL